jgi:penicillin amidase
MWQMELYRRASSGRLSEILGEATIPIDRRFLTLNLRHAAEIEWSNANAAVRTAIESYARGVNAAMAVGRTRLPIEMQLLGIRPEPWTAIDTLAIGKLFAWRLGENHNAELLRYELAQTLGPRAQELLPGPPEWAPTILTSLKGQRAESRGQHRPSSIVDGPSSMPTQPLALSPQPFQVPEWLAFASPAMSNSWVIAGSRTTTGRPLLANDPHLQIEMPSVWWEVHIATPAMNVTGVTIPGIPFVLIGHTDRYGWGLTNVGADVQDYFVERLDSSRTNYLVGTSWLPLGVVHHAIRVRGRSEPIQFDVRSTRHGTVLNAADWRDPQPGVFEGPHPLDETVLALKWPAIEGASAEAFHDIARGRTWTEFVAAVRKFAAPAQNFVYADVDGNIGYAMSGTLPIRSAGDGSIPLAGWEEGSDWRGSVPAEALPAELNPASGQVITANNEVSRDLPYTITRDWVAPFRSQRIAEMLGNRGQLDVEAMKRVQADLTNLYAGRLLTALGPAAPPELQGWDRRIDARPESAFFEVFQEAMWTRTFRDEMPPWLFERFYRYAGNERLAGLRAIISDVSSEWFDDRSTAGVRETRDDIARLAAEDARSDLREKFGDRSNWKWDDMHAVTFSHALAGGGRVLGWFFNRGPVPVPGDNMTVNKTVTNLRRPYQTSDAASFRQILDVGAWDRSLGVNTAGQSGHPRSPHYFDQNVLWRQGGYHPVPFSEEAVAAATVSTLVLTPETTEEP